MTNNAPFDLNALAAVKPGLSGTLAEISAQLERYFAAPANNAEALEAARTELRRLLGVLKMVGLEGVAVFCTEVEAALSELAAQPQQVTEARRDVLHRALSSVVHYLDALSNGAGNATLRLFPQYLELQQLRGIEAAFEADLFFPNLQVRLPQQILSMTIQGDARAGLKVLRSQYQQALLRWLRQEDAAAAVLQMQQALEGVMRCVPQDEGRAFWWVGSGLLECLKLEGLPPELNARKLLGRIDQQIRTVAEGNSADVRLVMNEMLYLIGRSHAVSGMLEAIKQLYALDNYLPESSALPPGEVEQLLSSMRDQLRITEESWEHAVQGDESSCEKFMKHAEQLVLLSEKLDRNTLQYLAKQIQVLSNYASTPEHARPIAIDMAMALLLLGSGIENYNRLDNGFQEQARILSERMQAAVKQQPEDTRQLSELVDLHYKMEQGEVMIPLANEMLVNLQHVEQGLNAYFNGAVQSQELNGLLRLLSQIRGGLLISSLDKAEQLLVSIQDEVRNFSQSKDAPKPVERYALADAVSALENYMQHLTHGQKIDDSRLQKALAEIAKLHQAQGESNAPPELPQTAVPAASAPVVPPQTVAQAASVPVAPPQASAPVASVTVAPPQAAVPAASTPVVPPQTVAPAASVPVAPPQVAAPVASAQAAPPQTAAPAQRPSDEDQELIDIFLEEAQEVLGSMRSNLEICHSQPGVIDPLVAIRRGFHTLKGSGRMVGLTDLGEVAWCVERAMNKWLQGNKPATSGLLRFISAAVQSFAGWVDVLGKQGELHIEAGDLIATAQKIENGLDIEAPPAPTPTAAAVTAEVEAEPEPVAEPSPLAFLEFDLAVAPESEPKPTPLPELEFELEAKPLTEPASVPLADLKLDLEIPLESAPEPEPTPLPELEFDFKAAPSTEPEAAPRTEFKSETLEAPPAEPPAIIATGFESEAVSVPAPAPQREFVAKPVPEAEAEEEIIRVGEITLSQALFNIASSEAVQNVAILQEQFDGLHAAEQQSVQYDFMRAAHTLVGLNRTMGFDVVVDLAYALEDWLRARMDQPFSPSDEQMQMLEQSIAALGDMVLSICDRQMPQGRSDLVDQLHADSGELLAGHLMNRPGATGAEPLSIPYAELQSIKEELLRPSDARAEASMLQVRGEKGDGGKTVQGSAGSPALDLQQAAPAPAKPGDEHDKAEEPQVQDDIDEQLLPVFLEEADDLCPKISEGLRAWRENPHDEQHVQSLKRLLHTMKGSSRMVGAMRIGEIAHEMEDRVSADVQAREEAGYWDALDSDFDLVNALLEELRGGKAVVMPAKAAATEAAEIRQAETGRRASDKQAGEPRVDRRASDQGAERSALGNVLRVRSEVVDKLVNDAGEISVARSRMETELRTFKDGLLELTASVMRLRHQLREVEIQAESQMQARVSLAKDSAEEFDPLEFDRFTRLQELTRFMNESVHDVQTVQRTLLKNLEEAAAVLLVQGRLSRELQQNLMNVRMVSFNSIADRLYRIVRQTGKELNKRANLELQGTGVELDRSVLEKMVAPFEHLLRNSIVHGLENDQLRAQAGKNPIGEIRLSVRQESNEVVFEFSDDGAGLNYAKLREKAIAKGMFQESEEVSDDQLAQLIFTAGLSTASEITEIAGRGVGMDVVRSEITALGGTIDVKSKRGQGTQFIIRLPLTLAVTQILLVRSGSTTYAVPSAMVEQVRQVKSADMNTLHADRKIEWQDRTYPLHYLSQLLSNTEVVQENHLRNSVLLLRSGEHRIALHVDELLGNQEAVVKNIGPQLARLPGIAGATVLGNGEVVLILNPPLLAQRAGISRAGKAVKAETEKSVKPLSNLPLIMVVDDSLTVRKITSRMLTRAGYQVVTATDGVDALEQLEDFTPDVMLLDIEMPRMDGFALARELRRDPKTQSMPIIMITSRTADKHRDYAMQLGVNTYLGKPYQEDELLQNIADFVAVHKLDA